MSQQTETVYIASLGRRLGAMLYDALLVLALWMLVFFVWIAAGDGEPVTGALPQVVLVILWVGFFVLFWMRSGQTLGMVAWRIKVLDPQTRNYPGFKQAVVRFITALPAGLLLGAGYWWMYIDDEKRTWPDRLSNTVVVHFPKKK